LSVRQYPSSVACTINIFTIVMIVMMIVKVMPQIGASL
jgi:hypothetical protein